MPTELDSLTGLANRRGFFEHLQHELGRALRQRRPLAVALYDLDRFKLFNDRAGHPAGDDALRRIGWLLRDLARDGDVVGRIGGDNFGAVFPGTTFEDALWISDLAQRRAAALPAYAELRLWLSYGVAELRLDDTAEEVLRRAELDLGARRAEGARRGTTGLPELHRPPPSTGRPSLRPVPGGPEGSDPDPGT